MKAVIMNGGKGTRMSKYFPGTPKCMLSMYGETVLEMQIKNLSKHNVDDIIIVTDSKTYNYISEHDTVGQALQVDGLAARYGVNIRYVIEDAHDAYKGTATSLFKLCETNKYLEDNEDFLLIFGDIIFEMKLESFMNFHKNMKHRSDNHIVTLVTHPSSHMFDSDLVLTNDYDETRINIIRKKNDPLFGSFYKNLTSSGIYCMNSSIFKNERIKHMIDEFSLQNNGKADVSDLLCVAKFLIEMYSYKTHEYIKDMGTPERFKEVKHDILVNIPTRKSVFPPAIFLDRDGTINEIEHGKFVNSSEDLVLYKYSAEAIKIFNSLGYLVIVVTNQGGISEGYMTEETLNYIHEKLETELGSKGAYVDDIFYCPHMGGCSCRKPKIGMITGAAKKYDIDLDNSWFIGDSTVDMKTGENAGLQTILLKSGVGGKDKKYEIKPDHTFKDLLKAAKFIKKINKYWFMS